MDADLVRYGNLRCTIPEFVWPRNKVPDVYGGVGMAVHLV